MEIHPISSDIPGPGRCIYRASRPSQGTVNGGAVSKWDVKHERTNKSSDKRRPCCEHYLSKNLIRTYSSQIHQ